MTWGPVSPPIPPPPISFLAMCPCTKHDTVWTATARLKGGVIYHIPCITKQQPDGGAA